jgi:glycosyltransferase involved in cell wall biosynthesis
MKKILYIHQYFITPREAGGTRSYWFSRELLNNNFKVVMITSRSNQDRLFQMELVDGIDVIFIKNDYDNSFGIMQRVWSFLRFMILSTFISFKQENIDLVFATSTPLTVGFPALLLKKIKKIPYLFEVRDLWPEVPIQMGGLKNKLLQKLAIFFEKTIYKNANHIIALSPGMYDGVIKYVSSNKVSMIPNMSKIDDFWPRKKNLDLLNKLGLKDSSFKIIHFGALGLANGIDSIIESAKLLKDDSSIEFVFIGGGSLEKSLIKQCKKYNLTNVHFLGKFNMKETSEIVNFCDISIISFLNIPILNTNSPNKLFDSLSAGKPIIVNSAGWTKDLVEKNKCGFYVNPSVHQELIEKILLLKKNPKIVFKMGESSRKLAENVYDKLLLTNQFLNVIKSNI